MAKALSKNLSKDISSKAKKEFHKNIGLALGSSRSDSGKLKKSKDVEPKYKK